MADQTELALLLSKIVLDLSDLKKDLAQGRSEMQSFKTMAQGVGESVKKAFAFAGVAVGIYEIVGALKSFAKEAAMVGARTETLAVGLELVGKNAGFSKSTLNYYVEQLKKLGITTQEAMNAVTRFIVSGLPLDKIEQLADVARNQAALVGKNTSEAFNDILTGIVTQQPEVLRKYLLNIGLLSTVLGKSADSLDPLTRSMKVLSATLDVGQRSAGAYEAEMETVGKQLKSMARYAEEAKNALWPIFQPAMLGFVQEMTRGYKDLEAWAKANKERLAEWGKAGAEWVKWLATGIRDIGAFIAENKNLLKTLAEIYIANKAAGWFTAMGASIKKTVVEMGIMAALLGKLKVLVGGPWRIIITLTLIGLYEAWTAIQNLRKEAGFTPKPLGMGEGLAGGIKEGVARDKTRMGKELDIAGGLDAGEAARRGISLEKYLELQKEDQNRNAAFFRPGRQLTIPSKVPPVLHEHETEEERRAREVGTAHQKALDDAKKYAGGGDKKGAKETADNLLTPYLSMLKAQRDADLQSAQNSLDLLQSTNDKKRAELARGLAAQEIDGQTYYLRLQEMNQAETTSALRMIEQKRQAQHKAYEDSLAQLAADPKLSGEAKEIARQKLVAENRKANLQLDVEAAKTKLDGEKKVTEELTRQVEIRQQYQQKTEDLNLETQQLLGNLTDQEAKLQRLTLDWQRAKQEAIKAWGYTPEYATALDANYQAKQFDVKYGDTLKNAGNEFSSTVTNIVNGIRQGTLDIGNALIDMFNKIMMDALKPGFDALGQALTSAVKWLLNSLSSSLGGGNLFGGQTYGSSTATYTSPGYVPGGYGYQNYSAHGNAFYHGIRQAFSAGGVVTRPTLFPMATGAGLMGEAGPEGILPLTRIGGDLGVKALFPAQAPPQVNVINNLGIEAEPKISMKDDGTLDIILEKKITNMVGRGGSLQKMILAINNRGF